MKVIVSFLGSLAVEEVRFQPLMNHDSVVLEVYLNILCEEETCENS